MSRLVVRGDWIEITGVSRGQMIEVREEFRRHINRAQERLVETKGASIGMRWRALKPATIRWKTHEGIPLEILRGRTGKLLMLVRKPAIFSFVEKSRIAMDVVVADEAVSPGGFRYAAAVHRGWRQRVQDVPRSGTGWSQLQWMRAFLWRGYQAGDEFGTPGRKLVGFTPAQVERWTVEAIRKVIDRSFRKGRWR